CSLKLNCVAQSASKRQIPTSSSSSVVQQSSNANQQLRRVAGIPSHSSQPVLLPSNRLLSREASQDSNNGSSNSDLEPSRVLAEFVGGLGPGQVAGRQALGAGSLGELHLTIQERQNSFVVNVNQARALKSPRNSKSLPAAYVKLYLMFGARRVAKQGIPKASKSLSPQFHQVCMFDQNDSFDALQAIVWGDFGPLDKKVFIGVAQIQLSSLDYSSSSVSGWYRLFPSSSIVNPSLSGTGSQLSIDTLG
ncbi:unnamed protein product, partial [Oikopleura dioica]